jgi:hypothetical protein
MRRVLGVMSFVLASCALACSSFSSNGDPAADGGAPDGAAPDATDAANASDGPDAADAADAALVRAVSIACGAQTCTGQGALCCRNDDLAIVPACGMGGCRATDVKVFCDDTADCPTNTVCCATITDGFHLDSVSCASSCDPKNDIRLCNPGTATECGPTLSCRTFGLANEKLHGNSGVSSAADGLYGCTQ